MELTIIKNELPIVECNFEEVKANLEVRLADYKKLVVTEESLTFCKNEQKHLAGLKKKIDDYRKKIKSEMSIPINEFENKCKELISFIAETEQPLKDGIVVFDDKKREMKKQFALNEIERICNELMLSEKYRGKILFNERHLNLSIKEKEVTDDIYKTVELLVAQQEKDIQIIKMVEKTIEKENEHITNKMVKSDFDRYINEQTTVFGIVEIIENESKKRQEVQAKIIKDAEELAARKIKEDEEKRLAEEIIKNTVMEVSIQTEGTPPDELTPEIVVEVIKEIQKIYSYNLKVTGNKDKLAKLKSFLQTEEIEFEFKLL